MNTLRYFTALSILLLVLLPQAPTSAAQQSQETEAVPTVSYEGQKVTSVEIAGRPDINLKKLRPLLPQQINAPYSQAKVDETVAMLKKSGPYKDVEVQVTPAAEGLRATFVLQPAYYFGVFSFPRAEKVFTYTRLLQAANYEKQTAYSLDRVEEAESNLLNFFHRTGFFEATVEPKLETDEKHAVVNVTFDVNLRKRAKFGNVLFAGATPAEGHDLSGSLRSVRARIRGAYLKPGKTWSLKKVTAATTFLQQQLGKRGYLAGRVKLVSTNYHPGTNRADLTFQVTQGPAITVKVQGVHIWGRTQKKLIPMYQENTVDADLVNEGAQDITSYFQSKGYFATKVQSRIERTASGATVVYQVQKGKRGKVASVDFKGNDHFSDKELGTHVPVSKGMRFNFLSHGKYSEQLVRKSVKNIKALYQGAGFSHVQVVPQVVTEKGDIKVRFQVDEGVRDVVESLQVEGNKALNEQQLAPKGMNLEPGKPYSQQLLEKDRDQIMATYLDRGYLTMTFKAKVQHLKNDPHHVDVIYTIDEGPEVQTSSVSPVGALHTRPEIIALNTNIKTGQPLSESALLRGESQLYTLGVFDWASVETRSPVVEDPNADVLVKLHESKRNSIAYGFGFQVINRGGSIPSGTIALPGLPPVGLPKQFTTSQKTFWGPEGSVEYIRRNFRGRAETVTVAAFGGRLDQRASINWVNPTFWNSSWSSTVNVSGERTSENPIFTARLGGAGIQFQHYLDRNRQKSVIFRYDFRRTNLSNVAIPDLVLPQDQSVRLSTLTASFARDTRDNPLDAHKGIYESFQGDVDPKVIGSNTNFARFLGQTAYYRSLSGESLVWANSIRYGMEGSFGGAHIPISETFFSGGGSTLRGFALNGAGPQRNVLVCPAESPGCNQTISVPVGGRQLVILNSELRFPLGISMPLLGGPLGGVAFYDGGNVFPSVGFGKFFDTYSNTAGFGVRYKTPVGPIRADLGHLMNAPPGVKSWQVFITLGQAF